jgi:hypothetical protein
MYAEASPEYERGNREGYKYALANYRLGYGPSIPDLSKTNQSYHCGYVEGFRAGANAAIDREYPGLIRLSLRLDGKYDLEYKDGRKEISR